MPRFIFPIALSCISFPSYAMQIEEVLPKAFKESSGIRVQSKDIAGVSGYAVEEFTDAPNRNHWDSRNSSDIKFLVMHYTVCDFPSTMNLFTRNVGSGRVSAHYVITQAEAENGILGGVPFQVVPEKERSWHAGLSDWGGVKNLNASAIGIENINKGFDGTDPHPTKWYPFDPDQIHTLGILSQDIVQRYKILPQNVVGHADIAWSRKQDPGILFPWGEMYTKYGVGAWLAEHEREPGFIATQFLPKEPFPKDVNEGFFLSCLRSFGYEIPESGVITPEIEGVVRTFKAHFSHNQQPEKYNATLDMDAMLWAWGLAAKYK